MVAEVGKDGILFWQHGGSWEPAMESNGVVMVKDNGVARRAEWYSEASMLATVLHTSSLSGVDLRCPGQLSSNPTLQIIVEKI